ncbi:hypothetical protein V6238_18310 [Marinomonas arenicola]|uniref:hypothetical protein n=1 Tax=Marinomonas arenicola TaxID=569601 RepID=UPI00311D2EE6
MKIKELFFDGAFYRGYTVDELVNIGVTRDVATAALVSQVAAEVASSRQSAYELESDPLFLEALRKDAAGDIEGAEEARAAALVAVDAIKARYPL